MADQRPEPWRPMSTAPKDGTIVRLLVDYRGDGCHPLEDADIAQTIGGCTDAHTGLSEGWKFAGWSWEQDCFCEGRGKPIGWLPFAHLDLSDADGVRENWRRPLGCCLAMRVLQSDLYHQLDDAERADCDELVRRNLDWCRADDARGVLPSSNDQPKEQ